MGWEKLELSASGVLRIVGSIALLGAIVDAARVVSFNEPYVPFALAGALVFFLRAVPSRIEIYSGLAVSALLFEVIHRPTVPFWVLWVAAALALPGLSAFLLLGLRAIWGRPDRRRNALVLLFPAVTLVVYMFAAAKFLAFSGTLSPRTYDLWLYLFDGSLGFQPSWTVGNIMVNSRILTAGAVLTYLSLPFAMAVVCAWRVPPRSTRISWHPIAVLMLAGVVGSILYNVVPATGPIYAFGSAFPSTTLPYKDLPRLALEKLAIPTNIPRNAMPSLHVGWVVLLFWNSRGFPRVLRALLLVYLLLTATFTLGGGQHYLIDLVVALPFVLAMQAAVAPEVADRSRRITVTGIGLALTLAWLFFLRFGVTVALKSLAIPWTLVLGTVSLSIWLEWRMRQTWPAKNELPVAVARKNPVGSP